MQTQTKASGFALFAIHPVLLGHFFMHSIGVAVIMHITQLRNMRNKNIYNK